MVVSVHKASLDGPGIISQGGRGSQSRQGDSGRQPQPLLCGVWSLSSKCCSKSLAGLPPVPSVLMRGDKPSIQCQADCRTKALPNSMDQTGVFSGQDDRPGGCLVQGAGGTLFLGVYHTYCIIFTMLSVTEFRTSVQKY